MAQAAIAQPLYKIDDEVKNNIGDQGCTILMKAYWPNLQDLNLRTSNDIKSSTKSVVTVVCSSKKPRGPIYAISTSVLPKLLRGK